MTVTAVPQAGGYVQVSWPAGPTGSTYDLCSSDQPDGVKGATDLTVTSSVRGPFSDGRKIQYWVKTYPPAVTSDKVTVTAATKPATGGTTGGTTTGGTTTPPPSTTPTIASVLDIGSGATSNHYYLGVGYEPPKVMTSITMAQLVSGWSDPAYAFPTPSGTAVSLKAYVDGDTTSGSNYPRTEFRETNADGSLAAWAAAGGKHHLSATTICPHLPPNRPSAVFAQIHDDQSDSFQFRVDEGVLGVKVGGVWPAGNGGKLTKYTYGDPLIWDLELDAGELSFYLSGQLVFQSPWFKTLTKKVQYFKAGLYLQTGGKSQYTEPSGEYGLVTLAALSTTHS